MTLTDLIDLSTARIAKYFLVRKLTKKLVWQQRYISMDNDAIDVLLANISDHSKKRMNLRCQLIDLGVDPDVVAPEEY